MSQIRVSNHKKKSLFADFDSIDLESNLSYFPLNPIRKVRIHRKSKKPSKVDLSTYFAPGPQETLDLRLLPKHPPLKDFKRKPKVLEPIKSTQVSQSLDLSGVSITKKTNELSNQCYTKPRLPSKTPDLPKKTPETFFTEELEVDLANYYPEYCTDVSTRSMSTELPKTPSYEQEGPRTQIGYCRLQKRLKEHKLSVQARVNQRNLKKFNGFSVDDFIRKLRNLKLAKYPSLYKTKVYK